MPGEPWDPPSTSWLTPWPACTAPHCAGHGAQPLRDLADAYDEHSPVAEVHRLRLDFAYVNDGPRRLEDQGGSCAVPDEVTADNVTVEFAHWLGEAVTSRDLFDVPDGHPNLLSFFTCPLVFR